MQGFIERHIRKIVVLNRHFVPNDGEDFLFPPAYLDLRHGKNFGGLSLCFAPIVPQLNYFSVGFAEGFYRLFKRQSFRDFVLNIICRDIKLWVALAVIFGSQGERNSCTVECINDFLLARIKPFGKLAHGEFSAVFQLVFIVKP